ncbi:hypothetical protein R3P38DRAFT_2793520 [Favolaschia claudopus]|uniref:Uncharacterized protein n=1 Tax=Favolaschia claudopus TaxID=2862362 RepID=A0AAW0AD58_9AGAR
MRKGKSATTSYEQQHAEANHISVEAAEATHMVNPVRRNAKKFEFARGANEMGVQGEVPAQREVVCRPLFTSREQATLHTSFTIGSERAYQGLNIKMNSATAASPFRATKIHQRDEEVETRMREIVRVCDNGTGKDWMLLGSSLQCRLGRSAFGLDRGGGTDMGPADLSRRARDAGRKDATAQRHASRVVVLVFHRSLRTTIFSSTRRKV